MMTYDKMGEGVAGRVLPVSYFPVQALCQWYKALENRGLRSLAIVLYLCIPIEDYA